MSVKVRTIDFGPGPGLVGLAACETPHGPRAAAVRNEAILTVQFFDLALLRTLRKTPLPHNDRP